MKNPKALDETNVPFNGSSTILNVNSSGVSSSFAIKIISKFWSSFVVKEAFSEIGASFTDSTVKLKILEVTFSPSDILKLTSNVPISSTVGIPNNWKLLICIQSGDSLIMIASILSSISSIKIV